MLTPERPTAGKVLTRQGQRLSRVARKGSNHAGQARRVTDYPLFQFVGDAVLSEGPTLDLVVWREFDPFVPFPPDWELADLSDYVSVVGGAKTALMPSWAGGKFTGSATWTFEAEGEEQPPAASRTMAGTMSLFEAASFGVELGAGISDALASSAKTLSRNPLSLIGPGLPFFGGVVTPSGGDNTGFSATVVLTLFRDSNLDDFNYGRI